MVSGRGVRCRIFGHRVNRYYAMRAPNLAAVGCRRCDKTVNLATDRW